MAGQKDGRYHQGKFSPKHPEKYRGDPTNIVYRSSWELRMMRYLDSNTNVLEWASEEVIVPYISPVDNRPHRYFPDFIAMVRRPDGGKKTVMIEIKPKAQTKEPKIQPKKTKRYITEVTTWAVNQAKWKAASEFCENRGWDFTIMTEDHIGIK
jgi:hypothetical protein